jgi:hypothetical protein
VSEGEKFRQGRGDRGRWRGEWRADNGADAVCVPNPDIALGLRRGEGDRRGQRGNDRNTNAVPHPQRERPDPGCDNRQPSTSG